MRPQCCVAFSVVSWHDYERTKADTPTLSPLERGEGRKAANLRFAVRVNGSMTLIAKSNLKL